MFVFFKSLVHSIPTGTLINAPSNSIPTPYIFLGNNGGSPSAPAPTPYIFLGNKGNTVSSAPPLKSTTGNTASIEGTGLVNTATADTDVTNNDTVPKQDPTTGIWYL